jgi:hypothetical protein
MTVLQIVFMGLAMNSCKATKVTQGGKSEVAGWQRRQDAEWETEPQWNQDCGFTAP